MPRHPSAALHECEHRPCTTVRSTALVPVTGQSWLFVRPLDLPLTFRHENGRFGSLRPKPLPGPPPCAAGQIIPADDPRNPTDADVYARTRNVDVTLRWRASTFWGVDVVTQVELT